MGQFLYEISVVFPEECQGILIDSLDFSNRLKNCIHRAGAHTLDELLNTDYDTLAKTRGFGAGCREELEDKLKSENFKNYIDACNRDYDSNVEVDRSMVFVKNLVGYQFERYSSYSLDTLNISEKTKKILKKQGFSTFQNLLQMPVDKLQNIPGLGMSGYRDIVKALKEFEISEGMGKLNFKSNPKISNAELSKILAINLEDYTGINIKQLNLKHRTLIRLINNNINTIGDLIQLTPEVLFNIPGFGNTSYNDLMNKLLLFGDQAGATRKTFGLSREERKDQVEIILSRLTSETLERNASDYVNAFKLVKPDFHTVLNNPEQSLYEFIRSRSKSDKYTEFLNWLVANEDYVDRVNRGIESIFADDPRGQSVLDLRINGRTLNDVSLRYQITRERARQIEGKICRKILWHTDIEQLCAYFYLHTFDNTAVLKSDIERVFPEYAKYLIYCFSLIKPVKYRYSDRFKVFLTINNVIQVDELEESVDELPEYFWGEELNKYLDILKEKTYLSIRACEQIIFCEYEKFGNCYSKGELPKSKMYAAVLRKYFNQGIHVYNHAELDKFRGYVWKEFGEVSVAENDHALGSAIIRLSILCGRGIYRLKSDRSYISKSLARDIERYIRRNKYLLINSIFAKFQNELLGFGIDNKYYLHGVLRELFDDKFYFKRDYVSTSKRITGIHDAVISFIRKSEVPVTKEEIKERFPGITDIIIIMSVNDRSIINLFGKYIHANQLDIYDGDVEYFESIIEMMLENNETIYAKDIYDYVKIDNETVLNRLGLFYSFSLFSVLQYMFEEKYQFMRPWIARTGVVINKPLDQVRDYLSANDVALVHEMLDIANNANYRFQGIQKFIDTFNNTHLMINKYELQSIDTLGLNEDTVKEIESEINIFETVRIDDILEQITLDIGCELNEWIIYSLIKKWGKKYEVTTVNNYKQSVSVIAPVGHMDTSEISSFIRKEYQEVPVDDIDDLIADLIMEELEDEL